MLRGEIQKSLTQAMKARDKRRLEALRYVWSLVKNAEIDEKKELDDGQVEKLVASEVKKRKQAIELMKSGGRDEVVKEEQEKLKVIEEFMPEQMGEGEIEKIVDEVMVGGDKDFGTVMGQVMGKTKGKADGKIVGEIVKKKLEGGGDK